MCKAQISTDMKTTVVSKQLRSQRQALQSYPRIFFSQFMHNSDPDPVQEFTLILRHLDLLRDDIHRVLRHLDFLRDDIHRVLRPVPSQVLFNVVIVFVYLILVHTNYPLELSLDSLQLTSIKSRLLTATLSFASLAISV